MLGLDLSIVFPPVGTQGAAMFVSAPIPDQDLPVGQPASIDLAAWFSYSGGTIAYAVSPALPAGLSLTGSVISGTPGAAAAAADYTVTATAQGGVLDGAQRQRVLRLSVQAGLAAPVNTVAPAISGPAEIGAVLSCSPGTWSGNPAPSYAYQWRRRPAGGSFADIPGAVGPVYTLVAADELHDIRCRVDATNSQGSAFANATIGPVTWPAPVNLVAPSVSGAAPVGSVLSVDPGQWADPASLSFAFQWRADGTDIAGATASSYTSQPGDLGAAVDCVVTATNSGGTLAVASSNAVTVGAALAAPVNTVPPAISGTAEVGQVLSCAPGTWTGNPVPGLSYQWQRDTGGGFADIPGATTADYSLAVADDAATIGCTVTAANSEGAASAQATAGPVLSTPAAQPAALVFQVTAGTGDVTAPVFLSSNPPIGATGVAVTTTIAASFSEPIALGAGAVTIRNASDGTDIEILDAVADAGSGLTVAGSTLTVTPSADLPAGKRVALRIAAGAVADAAGNAFAGIADDATLFFDTAPAVGPLSRLFHADEDSWAATHSFAVGSMNGPVLLVLGHYGNVTSITVDGTEVVGTRLAGSTGNAPEISVFSHTADPAQPGQVTVTLDQTNRRVCLAVFETGGRAVAAHGYAGGTAATLDASIATQAGDALIVASSNIEQAATITVDGTAYSVAGPDWSDVNYDSTIHHSVVGLNAVGAGAPLSISSAITSSYKQHGAVALVLR